MNRQARDENTLIKKVGCSKLPFKVRITMITTSENVPRQIRKAKKNHSFRNGGNVCHM